MEPCLYPHPDVFSSTTIELSRRRLLSLRIQLFIRRTIVPRLCARFHALPPEMVSPMPPTELNESVSSQSPIRPHAEEGKTDSKDSKGLSC